MSSSPCPCASIPKETDTKLVSNFHISKRIESLKISGTLQETFQHVDNLFPSETSTFDRTGTLQTILDRQYARMTLDLPDGKRASLIKVSLVAPDFKVVTSSETDAKVLPDSGLHYHGTVDGAESSTVTLSFYANQIIGAVNYIAEGSYLIYTEDNQYHYTTKDTSVHDIKSDWCGTLNRVSPLTLSELQGPPASALLISKCVPIYFEVDQDIYLNKGSSIPTVTTFVTSMFNQVKLLYANEGIPLVISQIFVWTTTSPYAGYNTSGDLLTRFGQVRTSYNGRFAHLLALRGGGGIAWIGSNMCTDLPQYRQAFSAITSTFNNYPTYSWNVFVIAHELGHNFGSSHTHDCVWNGNNTAIDGCQTPVGCSNPGYPLNGGSIMSYCHLVSGVGVNFAGVGFGPQPGNVLRSHYVAGTSCLPDCSAPVITITPSSLSFSGIVGGSNPSSQTVSLTNTGGGTLSWTATDNATWLTISPTSGIAPSTVTVAVNLAGLLANTYNALITFNASGVTSKTLPVTLLVTTISPPTIILNPTTLTFTSTLGGSNPAPRSISITNSGGGTLNWAVSENASWLTVSPVTGTAPSSITVAVNMSGLSAGTYNAVLTVSGSGSGGAALTKTASITFTVNPSSDCKGGTLYTGTFTGSGNDRFIRYTTTTSGIHSLTLSGTGDIDMQLYLWNSTLPGPYGWQRVASSQGPTATEQITYSGEAGRYFAYLVNYSGTNTYSLCLQRPT